MIRSLVSVAAVCLATSCAVTSPAPPTVSEALRKEFAPTGVLRAGTNYGNPVIVQRDPAGGAPRGVGPDLARELAKRLGVPITYVTYDAAGKMADAVKQGAWDVAFLAVDPAREIDFSAPYVQIEGTYLVRADSPMRAIADLDKPGVRISVGKGSAYDLYLSRALKQAKLVQAPTSLAAIDLFKEQRLDAAAGVKNPLVDAAAKDPGLRVIDGNFMVIGQASGVPRGRPAAAKYLREFIEEMKASGFVARSLAASGITDATVAPAAR
jgi:polar amino acid transport system substrate-binding protein